MTRLDRAVCLLPWLLALAACEGRDPVILSLDGESVRRSAFERHVAALEARGLGNITPEARAGLLSAFLEQQALLLEARRTGLLAAGGTAEQESDAVSRLLAKAAGPVEVSDQEIAAAFAAHQAEQVAPERLALRQILVTTSNEARDIKRRLGRDPRAFDTLARTLSKGPEAVMGGYMGTFERGQLPAELEAAAFALPEGGTSEPIETPLGYHVLRVESHQAARVMTLDEARGKIRERLAREKRLAAERQFVAALLARSKVNHEAALRSRRP